MANKMKIAYAMYDRIDILSKYNIGTRNILSQSDGQQFTYIDYNTSCIQVGDGKNPCISTTLTGTFEVPPQVNSKDVVSIGDYAFKNSKISNIKLPDTILYIGSYAFLGSNITEFICPKNVIQIKDQAFAWCECRFADFSQAKLLSFIGSYHFSGSNITSILLPDSLHTISVHMFFSSKLKSVTIPKSCKEILSGAFICCAYLETFKSESPDFCVHNNILYSKDYKTLVAYPSNCYIDILPTVKYVSSARGFSGSSLINFTLNVKIISFSSHSFRYCPYLEYVDISCSKAVSIENAIFHDSNKLKTLILPPLLTNIGVYAFCYTNITELVIPPGVRTIASSAFDDTNITDIFYCGTNTFDTISFDRNNVNVHVSDSFPKSSTKFLGCEIVDRTYTCQDYICSNFVDQSFMDCPTMNLCFYNHFYFNILSYSGMIVM